MDEVELGKVRVRHSESAAGPAKSVEISVAPSLDSLPLPERAARKARETYVAERFPEVAAGFINLDDAESVISGARLYHQEDGDSAKAAEFLSYAIANNGGDLRLWLALFEVHKQATNRVAFEKDALKFQERFGDSELWPKIQAAGRAVDPTNPLYGPIPNSPLKSDAAPTAGAPNDATLDTAPVTDEMLEDWLNTPLDFTPVILGTDLRESLLCEPEPQAESSIANAASAARATEHDSEHELRWDAVRDLVEGEPEPASEVLPESSPDAEGKLANTTKQALDGLLGLREKA
jgi:hypothetical protein